MAQISRTYIDSCVLIEAWRGAGPNRLRAQKLLLDGSRTFVASRIVVLETIPKAKYNKNAAEVTFYANALALIDEWIPIDDAVVELAVELSCLHDIVGVDALHVAAALTAKVDQYVTCEKSSKPMFRAKTVNPTNLETLY